MVNLLHQSFIYFFQSEAHLKEYNYIFSLISSAAFVVYGWMLWHKIKPTDVLYCRSLWAVGEFHNVSSDHILWFFVFINLSVKCACKWNWIKCYFRELSLTLLCMNTSKQCCLSIWMDLNPPSSSLDLSILAVVLNSHYIITYFRCLFLEFNNCLL